jgi:hypothetical protein
MAISYKLLDQNLIPLSFPGTRFNSVTVGTSMSSEFHTAFVQIFAAKILPSTILSHVTAFNASSEVSIALGAISCSSK